MRDQSLPPAASVPSTRRSALLVTRAGSTVVALIPFAKAVIAASICAADVVQLPPSQQLCDSPTGAGLTLITKRESAGVSRLIFDVAAA